MMEFFKSKKLVISVVGVIAITAVIMCNTDAEMVKWFGGFVTAIVASFNIGQGIADGGSNGKTSAGRAGETAD